VDGQPNLPAHAYHGPLPSVEQGAILLNMWLNNQPLSISILNPPLPMESLNLDVQRSPHQ